MKRDLSKNEWISLIFTATQIINIWAHAGVHAYMDNGYEGVSILSGFVVFACIIFISCVLWVKKEIVK